MEDILEYELLNIEWKLDYFFEESDTPRLVRDGSMNNILSGSEPNLDENGIPKGQSMDDIRTRESIIDAFFRKWYEEHPNKEVYNSKVADNILIRKVSIDEAKQHASKNYLSTIAILYHFDEILANAESIGKTAIKPNDRNQSHFDYMLIMSYSCPNIGLVKLTIGIKKKKMSELEVSELKTEYGLSVLEEGSKIEIPRKSDKRKKKAPHK